MAILPDASQKPRPESPARRPDEKPVQEQEKRTVIFLLACIDSQPWQPLDQCRNGERARDR
jgi:hypothetical protein